MLPGYATGQPQLPVSNTTYNNATQTSSFSNVDYLNVNIFDDYEKPSGYTKPTYYDYVTPATGFDPVSTANPAIFNLVVSAINGQMELQDGTPISIDFLTTDTGVAPPAWQNIVVPQTNFGAFSRLQTQFTYNSTSQTFTASGSGAFDQLQLNNLPLPDPGGIGWYRLHIGSGAAERVTNFYLTTTPSSVSGYVNNPILNPNYSGQTGSFGIDNLVVASFGQNTNLQPIQYVSGITLNILPGSSALVDSSLLNRVTYVSNTVAVQTQPSNPLMGTQGTNGFTRYTGSLSNVTQPIAFGWAGADSAYNTTQNNENIGAFTNKVSSKDYATISFTAISGSAPASVTVQADLDGNWQTGYLTLQAGTYTAAMTEYLWSNQS